MAAITGRTPAHAVTVTATADLTPRMRRVTLAGPSLVGLATTPAQDLEIVLVDSTGRRVKRRYTIRHARADTGEWDVDALRHDHGPGGRWASSVRPGDRLEFLGPRGKLELRDADWNLFVGDEAALPAIAALVEAASAPSRVVVEVESADDELAIPGADVTWLHRGARPPGTAELLAGALSGLSAPSGAGQAYLLGESRAVVALRPAVEALGIPGERMFVKGYWNAGRRTASI